LLLGAKTTFVQSSPIASMLLRPGRKVVPFKLGKVPPGNFNRLRWVGTDDFVATFYKKPSEFPLFGRPILRRIGPDNSPSNKILLP